MEPAAGFTKKQLLELLEKFEDVIENEEGLHRARPVMVAFVFPDGDFIKAGLRDRDGDFMSEACIRMATDELELENEREAKRNAS